MSEFVRVMHPVFGEISVVDPDPDEVKILDKPAVDQNGDVLPGKPKTSVAKKAAENSGGEPAETPKEGSK